MNLIDCDCQQATEYLRDEFGFDFVAIGLAPEPGAPLKWSHASGATGERYKRIVLSPGHGIGGIVLKAGKPMMFTDIDNQLDPREYSSYPIVFAEDLRSFCALPLITGAHVMGVLLCAYRTASPGHEATFRQLMDTVKNGMSGYTVNEDDFLTFNQLPHHHGIMDTYSGISKETILQGNPDVAAQSQQGETKLTALESKIAFATGQAQERERKRISRELHDGVAQEILSVSMLLKQIGLMHHDEETARIIHEAETDIDRILGEIHNLSVQLRPLALDDLGLIAALRTQADLYRKTFGAHITVDDSTDGKRYNRAIETQAYRITQEALLNACKYSQSDTIGIAVADDGNELAIAVYDQGCGFDAAHPVVKGYGCGLSGMRERAALVGGVLAIYSGEGGTTVSLRIPHEGGTAK
jgi:two-component system sensor histidine kinase NreB